jgi:hypothetical protein
MGDMCVCTGPPDTIILGSTGVLIGGKPAARMGDSCAHGGTIVIGCPTVLIGEVSPDGMNKMSPVVNAFLLKLADFDAGAAAGLAVRQTLSLKKAAADGVPFCEICEEARKAAEDKYKSGASRGGKAENTDEDTEVKKKINKLYFKDKEGNPITEVTEELEVFLVIEGENIAGEEMIINLFDNADDFSYEGEKVENDQLILTASGDVHEIKLGILPKKGMRTGAYKQTVIYESGVPQDSVGWNEEIFKGLGNERHDIGTWQQQCEEVYLLSNIEKGGMKAAIDIAKKHGIGIAVRGTGTLAHMGIESGDPTKAQEFKNKTSKHVDLLLCDQLKYQDLGSVLHFDPRVGWTPERGASDAAQHIPFVDLVPERFWKKGDWGIKKDHIISHRLPRIKNMPSDALIQILKMGNEQLEEESGQSESGMKSRMYEIIKNEDWSGWSKVQAKFEGRVKEYGDEDHNYREGGHYYEQAHLDGVHLRTKLAKDKTMVGDHDLFGYTDLATHRFLSDTDPRVVMAQKELQESAGFQAQHGGIWNWAPPEEQKHIRDKIMGAHGPQDDEPLVYITNYESRPVYAAFYVKGATGEEDSVRSTWDYPESKKWYPAYYKDPAKQKNSPSSQEPSH